MDLVSGEAAMEFWEISPEELAGIALAFKVPCFHPETYEEAIPPTALALEILCYEAAFGLKTILKLIEGGRNIQDFTTERSLRLINNYESIMHGLKNERTVRVKEIEEIKSLLFSKDDIYYWISNVRNCGSITTCSKIKQIESLKYTENKSLIETKDAMFFLAGYQTQMFDDLKATLSALPKIDEITKEFKKITSSATKKKDETPVRGISGSAIIRRWSDSSLDIKTALRDGSLTPVNKLPGDSADCGPRRTKSMDPCLYCEDGPVGGECEHLPEEDYCPGRTPEEQLFRINNEIFLMDEVKRYEEHMGFANDDGRLKSRQEPEITRPTTPFEYIELWRSQGVRDPKVLASRIDDVFTGDHKLSNRDLGLLLPANPGCEITSRGQTDRGKRLRGLKK